CGAIAGRAHSRRSATRARHCSASNRSTAPAITCSDAGCWRRTARSRPTRPPTAVSISRRRWVRLIPELLLAPDLKLPLDSFDVGQRRQSRLVAEALDLVGGGRAGKLEMLLPALARTVEIRKHVGAMEHIAGAVGIEHPFGRDRQRGQRANGASLVIPE